MIKEPQVSDGVHQVGHEDEITHDDEITPSVVPTGVKNDGDVALLEGYNLYDNPLWNVEKEGDTCFQVVTSSLSVPILDGA